MLFSGISTAEHDKEHQLFFLPQVTSHFTLFMLLLTEKSLAGKTTVYSSTTPYFYFEIKLEQF